MHPKNKTAQRPCLTRADLPELKKAERAQLFSALGSFETADLADPAFIRQCLVLLDPTRIPDLAEAQANGDWDQAAQLVHRTCLPPQSAQKQAPGTSPTDAVTRQADAVLANRFSFYEETWQLPADIDWDANPGTAHWGHDLNRFSYLNPLTHAWRKTRDTRYSRKAIDLILDWISKTDAAQCFQGTPYVWGSYLNNAIHCAAWCRCLSQLPPSTITPLELLRVLKSLQEQLAYLEIVTHNHQGNWPTIGCQGMIQCLAIFPVLRDHNRFVTHAIDTMTDQISRQLLPDGVQDELTPHYHRCVVNNILSMLRSLKKLKREPDAELLQTLRKMVHYIQQTTMPDGSKQAAFNDSDPGCPGKIRNQLEALGLEPFLSSPEQIGPEFFPYAGTAFLRQRADQGDLYLAFDAGPFGRSHQHEDKLGFWLFAFGRNLLVDPGRHLYDHSEKSFYAYLKSTHARPLHDSP